MNLFFQQTRRYQLPCKYHCITCQENDREKHFISKGGGLSSMDGHRPSRSCLPPSWVPHAPPHGSANCIRASCTHHTVWCWRWCSQACLWPHKYSSHNPFLKHWRRSEWICDLCSQSSRRPGLLLACNKRRYCWSGSTIVKQQTEGAGRTQSYHSFILQGSLLPHKKTLSSS